MLNKAQQSTLARLADWVVSDMIQCTRARRQRERRRMADVISATQREIDDSGCEEPILRALKDTYPDATINLQSSQSPYIELEGRGPVLPSDLQDGLWEDIDYLDDFIAKSNHMELPTTRVVRVIAAQCESISGPSLLVVASKDFRLIFDDIDSWFVQSCAVMLSQMWHKRLLAEAMRAKEKFLRGFSHQLRTPIHGILGSVDLLAEELKSWDLRRSANLESALLEAASADTSGEPTIYLDTIKTAGQDLVSVVNSMITLNTWADIALTDRHYATYTVDELETDFANETLKAISGDTRHRASMFFDHDLPSDCDSLRIDLSLLRHSLIPLIINAVQSMTEGVVRVTTSIHSNRKEFIVDVRDTGRGIHPDHQKLIFEMYEKIGEHSTGAGLGLTLASKFAELLHGSVVLVSSEIGRGSHFRATFQEVELVSSAPVSQPPPKLKSLPSKFYTMRSGLDDVSLCDYFAEFLTSRGFTSSDSTEDCLLIFDFVPDLKQRNAQFPRIPSEQVAICLVPASEDATCLEQPPNNVVYVSGPFLSSTMSAALEDADRLLAEIKDSHASLVRPDEPSLMPPKIDEGTSRDERTSADEGKSADESTSAKEGMSMNGCTDECKSAHEEVGPITNSSHPKGQPAPPPVDDSIDVGLVTIAPPKYRPSQMALAESTLVIRNVPTLISSSKPTALLVDDNFVNLRIMQMYCSKRGLPYHCATDGLQAVEKFSLLQSSSASSGTAPIQLILMDLQMPACDGIEATRQIRSLEKQNRWRESIIFMVTGQDSPADRRAAEDVGAEEYFVKPVSIKNLDRGVKRYFPTFEGNSKS